MGNRWRWLGVWVLAFTAGGGAGAQEPSAELATPTAVISPACASAAAGVPSASGWYRQPMSDTVIVFVHGILSDSRAAWLASESPCTFWPQLVASDTSSFGRPAVFLGGYYSGVDAGSASVQDVASQLFTSLSLPSGTSAVAPLSHNKIVFVAHSLGGIVVRKMLVDYAPQFADHKISVLLYASPTQGSQYADLLSWLEAAYPFALLRELRTNNDTLRAINDGFRQFVNERRARGQPLHVAEFFESRFPKLECDPTRWAFTKWMFGTGCKLVAANMPEIVPRDAAGYFDTTPARLPGTDHISIVKPLRTTDDAHQRLVLSLGSFNMAPVQQAFAPALGTVSVTGRIGKGLWEPEGPAGDLVTGAGRPCADGAASGSPPLLCRSSREVPAYNRPPREGDIGFVVLRTELTSLQGTVTFGQTEFPGADAVRSTDAQNRPVLSALNVYVGGYQPDAAGMVAALRTTKFQSMRYRMQYSEWGIPQQALPDVQGQTLELRVPATVQDAEISQNSIAGSSRHRLADLRPDNRLGVLVFKEVVAAEGASLYRFAVEPRRGRLR